MALNTTTPRVEYTASSSQVQFTFSFKVFDDTDLLVYQTPTGQTANDETDILTLTTDYTVTIDGDDGGYITLTSGATSGDKITLTRSLVVVRETDYQQGGDILADVMDNDQNYQTYMIQDLNISKTRYIQLPNSLQGTSNVLPSPNADYYIKWNSSGNALENDDTIPTNVQLAIDKAAEASGYADDADIAKQAAQAAQAAAEAVYDTFDDRYLGAKVSAPTLDNDGNSLQDGAIYYNTTANVLYIYDLGTTTWLGLPVTNLNTLQDVDVSSLAINDILRWDGTNWINEKRIIDTIADLRLQTEYPDTIYVTGYHTANDGAFGSNFFRWNNTSTEDDNGGTIIKLDSVETGRYELQYDGAVNVKWFGAKGDNSTDDSDAIQATFNSLNYDYRGIGKVYFPKGNYVVNTAINPVLNKNVSYGGRILKQGKFPEVQIIGESLQSTVITSTSTNKLFHFIATSISYNIAVSFENISLIGNNQSEDGIYINNNEMALAYMKLLNVSISDFNYGYWYNGYEGGGGYVDGHFYGENLYLGRNNIGAKFAVDNVLLVNSYITYNDIYGCEINEGRAIKFVGGKIQYNGYDEAVNSCQVYIGGTTTRDDNVGNISFDGVYFEPTKETLNISPFIRVQPQDAERLNYVAGLTIHNCYINGKDCSSMIYLGDRSYLENLSFENNHITGFKLSNNSLVSAENSQSYVKNGLLQSNNTLIVNDISGNLLHRDDVMIQGTKASIAEVKTNVQNMLGVKEVHFLSSAVGSGNVLTTNVKLTDYAEIFRITINGEYITGGHPAFAGIGVYLIVSDFSGGTLYHAVKDIVASADYTIGIDGSNFITITCNATRQYGYTIERIA